jgi:hypothetical protein
MWTAESRSLTARRLAASRLTVFLVLLLSIGACGEASRTDALPLVGPLASFTSPPLGTQVGALMRERSAATRAPLGGVREVVGDWVLHYDVPPPTADAPFETMRVSEITAMRALVDTQAAAQLHDSLLAVIGPSVTQRCVSVRRGRLRAPATIVRRGDREYMLGYWSRELPALNGQDSTQGDSLAANAQGPERIPLPILFAVTYRPAADSRLGEDESACGTTAPAAVK